MIATPKPLGKKGETGGKKGKGDKKKNPTKEHQVPEGKKEDQRMV